MEAITDKDGQARFTVEAAHLQLWSPEKPKLYRVEILTASDHITEEIGFRTIETRGTEILLNGRSIFLRGIDMHEEIDTVGVWGSNPHAPTIFFDPDLAKTSARPQKLRRSYLGICVRSGECA